MPLNDRLVTVMPFEAKAELKEKEAVVRGMEVMSVRAIVKRKERANSIVG